MAAIGTFVKAKPTSLGVVEIRQNGAYYYLYVGDELKYYSSDFTFIMTQYDSYR